MAPDGVALRLRLREREVPQGPPDVAAFCRTPAPAHVADALRRADDLGVLAGSPRGDSRAPLTIFFQHASHPIPAIETAPLDGPPDVSSWRLQPTLFGYLASVPRPRSTPSRQRTARVVAACLPLLWPLHAEASTDRDAGAERAVPEVQRPARTNTEVPTPPETDEDDGTEPDDDPESEDPSEASPTDPSAAGDADVIDGDDPSATTDVLGPQREPPPAPTTDAMGVGIDQATRDAAWEGVDGFHVVLELKGGRTMRGRVGAVQRDTFTLIEDKTGTVLVMPKSGVVSLRVHVPGPVPTQTGAGLLIGGTVLTVIGTPVFISGVTILALCPSCASIHIPLLLIGGGALGGGIPMIVKGNRRRRVYQEALQDRQASPVVMRTRHGWTGGVRFRF